MSAISVIEQLVLSVESGSPAALCTVVKTKGSTPQSPGAVMLVRGDFSTEGTLGGGCVEAEVCRRAFEDLQQGGRDHLHEFVLDHDYSWDDGLICGGKMAIAFTPVRNTDDLEPFRRALQLARQHRPASVVLRVDAEGQETTYVLHLEVAPMLLIAGAGHVGQAVAKLVAGLDFRVTVFDDRADYARADRFPEGADIVVGNMADSLRSFAIDRSCYVIIVTRGHRNDHQCLEVVVESSAGYIGLIGSRRKSRMIFDDLLKTGVARERIERVHTPIGLGIGAVTVPEIAVSIAAELIKVRRSVTPKLVETK